MRLTVVGASGGIGRQVLAQAVGAGHDVTAVVRRADAVTAPVRVVVADLATASPGDVVPAVHGADAVISGLGPRGRDDLGVVSRGTATLAAAMTETGARRLVTVSAAPVGGMPGSGGPGADPGDDALTRLVLAPLLRRILRGPYADLAAMESILRVGDLDWTVVRPPRLTRGPLTAGYRVALDRNVPSGRSVSRADVAHLLLGVLHRPETIGHTVGVAT